MLHFFRASISPQKQKKANWRSQLHPQRSKIHSIPLGPSEKNSFCAKAQRKRDMCDAILREKTHFGAFPEAKKLTGALSCMHKGPKCIQSLWDHPEKNTFVQKHIEGAICAILREKPHFGAFPEAKKGVVICAMLRTGPIIMQIPRGYQKKKFIV